MDGGFAEHYVAYNGEEDEQHVEERNQHQQQFSSDRGMDSFNNVDDSAGNDLNNDHHHRDSSSGKLFVGGIAWETSEETFANYFCKYGEITDSVIMMDKFSGRPRGFGFVTFADPAVADRVLEEDHIIDGRAVEVKRTVPREEMQVKGVQKTRKIFVGGIPPSLTEDELKEYFSSYGPVAEHQIMLDHNTGRSRGFGFVTFENEDSVERLFSDGRTHELGGKQVEIKKAVPKRVGGDYSNDGRPYHGGGGGGGGSKSYGGFSSGSAEYGSGYGGKMTRGYGGAYGGYGSYGNYGGNYGGAAGFYGGYGGYGYGFGFWNPMYGAGAYGGSSYGTPGGYGGGAGGGAGHSGGKGYAGSSGSGFSGGKGYGNASSGSGRYHPYRK